MLDILWPGPLLRPALRWALTAVTLTLVLRSAPVGAASPLAGRTIVLNAEEGGSETGGIAFGVEEKNINLPITLDVGALLDQSGARVVYTRTSDVTVTLAARAALANRVGADVFLTIAANTLSDPSYSGVITFYGKPGGGYKGGVSLSPALAARSRVLAQDVQAGVQQSTAEVDHGVRSANFYVLGHAAMPAVLIETGFMTNPSELQKLTTPSYQQAVAEGIVAGLAQYFSGAGAVPLASLPQASPAPDATSTSDATGTSDAPSTSDATGTSDTLDAVPAFQPYWVEVTQATPLYSGPSDPAVRFGILPQWSPLQVLAPQDGARLYVRNPGTGGTAYVDAAAVGPSGPPTSDAGTPPSAGSAAYVVKLHDSLSAIAHAFGLSTSALAQANGIADPNDIVVGQVLQVPGGAATFQPFWVANFVKTALWSGSNRAAKDFGPVAPFTPMEVLAPADGNRYLVRVWTTGGQAYVDAATVGPVGPPKGAQG